MKIVEPKYEILTDISEGGIKELQQIERVARVCYKSEDKITPDGESAKKLVGFLVKQGHEAMLEHSQLSVLFTCDRGVANELVRHRIASFAQESTRYCNYSKEKFGGELTFIWPSYIRGEQYCELNDSEVTIKSSFLEAMTYAEKNYKLMIANGMRPEQARCVLPLCLKTEIVVTANYREWRNIFKLRTPVAAHPQMRELMCPLLMELQKKIPVVFDDIYTYWPADDQTRKVSMKGIDKKYIDALQQFGFHLYTTETGYKLCYNPIGGTFSANFNDENFVENLINFAETFDPSTYASVEIEGPCSIKELAETVKNMEKIQLLLLKVALAFVKIDKESMVNENAAKNV